MLTPWPPAAGVPPLQHSCWKGLTRLEELRLLNAAQTPRVRPGTGTDQGLCNHTLLVVLLGSGLRVSEVLNLDQGQYTSKGFTRVQAKGGMVRDVVPVHREARQVLDAWLEGRQDDAPSSSRALADDSPVVKQRPLSGALLHRPRRIYPKRNELTYPHMCYGIPSYASSPKPKVSTTPARPPGI